ncbi:phenylalanine--tRNA ligase subunit beta [Clostridium sp. Cult2]|uniref:phenylalanine--tRNA ligase subunit beta n=1 Tax=Clostridium sp. Cult2 TaxID=2079003 RepID=UPI001F02FE06|nr:phenylalanine--tRNA ligase subunit beta [Clostridium sp. Cult2]MCF6465211.1 phenylalanine--tRNA ligase subunit beta [Clostridium sp. Cult2]
MLLPVKWLKEYINLDVDSKILADNLTLSGSHVESIISLDRGIEKVLVGRIEKIEKHKDADKLLVIMVNIGEETIQIVTGATNLKIGDYVPVAIIGAKLPKDIQIEKTDFRGVESNGMLCSLKELGYEDGVIPKHQRDGIFVLDKEYPLGTPIDEILGLYGEIIELEITPNRPDCLSIIGMARETAATFNKKLKLPKIMVKDEVHDIKDYVESIEVDKDLCNRYYARVIKDIEIKESPLWLQINLMEAGIRPINNIVDITNFVMLEFGQPLHAFDLDKLKNKKILVRRAKDEEKIKTIDDQVRTLTNNNLVITDGVDPIGIAGVMGGMDSEVTEETTTVLLEAANFDDKSVRLTSKEHNLRTEASARFEKGLDPNLCKTAAERVCQLVEEIGAGKVVKGYMDVYENIREEKIIQLRPEKVNNLLGTDLNIDQMVDYLERLDLKTNLNENNIDVNIPTYRLDLNIEADLIEEIGRLYGFHNIPTQPLVGVFTRGEKPYSRIVSDKASIILQGLGINEVITYSFISPKVYDKIKVEPDSKLRDYIKLINPLGEDYSVMRTTLIPNMLDLLSRNYNHGVKVCYLYEIGNIFIPKELPLKDLPKEEKTLSIGMYGDIDFYDLKEVVVTLLERLGIKDLEYTKEENNPTFHPNRTANILLDGENIGTLGEIHMDVLENYDIDTRVYVAQLNFDTIVREANLDRKYRPLPKYPAILRDIAVVVDSNILVGDLEKIIVENGEGLIEKVELFDVYEGKQILEGKKSVAFSITYRSYHRTLKDEEVNTIHQRIIENLENELDAKLRS